MRTGLLVAGLVVLGAGFASLATVGAGAGACPMDRACLQSPLGPLVGGFFLVFGTILLVFAVVRSGRDGRPSDPLAGPAPTAPSPRLRPPLRADLPATASFCSRCGTPIAGRMLFCSKCGAPVGAG